MRTNWRDRHGVVHQTALRSWQIKMLCGAVATYQCRQTESSVDCMGCLVKGAT
jgi:hypothetical protein